MIDRILEFSIKQKPLVGFLVLMLIISGIYSLINLSVDAVPDITNNQIQIITSSPTLSATEIERFISYPIEISMKSIPEVTELRSLSKSGISVVTVVFDDNVDIYFARNLVFQKLKEAEEYIPDGLGNPEMAPVSTGLGEIYQYVIKPADKKDTSYSLSMLREIQDWIVKSQLLGTSGVAEINSFGGFEKQFHVHINPDALMSFDITLREVYDAVIKNNSNAGGGFIEKNSEQYSVRGIGLLENADDLKNIVVKTVHGIPVYLNQIADIQYGNGLRSGAVTQDGEGEAVTGIVMMLKGANSKQTVKSVMEKIERIKPSLPDGLKIEEFYNRDKLVDKTINTVQKNLAEGGIIVVAVLLLLLGNFRAGLIAASVIPLSMLFALIMMNIFDVSGNLMSLGAIDFGLIVDGAVIIVEAVIVSIGARIRLTGNIPDKKELNENVFNATSGIIKSAVFGILIILIVYIPIFSLGGIEGKMFRPMALTVGFALAGSLILCLTYVPMMCSLILKFKSGERKTIADKILNYVRKIYLPLIEYSLRKKTAVISVVLFIIAAAAYTFTKLGGEFIPKLEEGDIAFHIIRQQGVSLTESNIISTKVEAVLKNKFPEIITVVTKTGAAEISTDPMGVELSDVFVILKDKDEWTSAKTMKELIEKMKNELSIIPGIGLSFSQPIEMKFNELLSGARSDVAVKIFGEDLPALANLAEETGKVMKSIKGAEEVSVQQIEGLPQLQIKTDRNKIAKYGISIEDINDVIETALGGKSAGVIFEGDRRFDIVIKYPDEFKNDIGSVKNIIVPSAAGFNLPLSELADVSFREGYSEISRDEGKRRILIQCNVRDRDIENFIGELKQSIDKKVKLPAGYTIEYGGQFENLENARSRLIIAVPITLLFIFALLFAAFNSVKQGLLVFSGIPFAAAGGIFSLWLRDIPFSISAGIGFIALFGVAVLNGIVMIAYFNRLENEGVADVHERIIKGAITRLRPILMTALVASLGFIPMAVSHGAGAEVQRPLATVVIGGLISSTLLTLIVLPVLYGIFNKHTPPEYKFIKSN